MGQTILRRLAAVPPVLLVVGTLVFLLVHLTPGDPAGYMLGSDATPADVARLRTAFGLDQPLVVQYIRWLWRAVQGDLGESLFLRKSVVAVIGERMEPTLLLTGLAAVLAMVLGVGAGILAATRHNTWTDRAVMATATLGVSIPGFWLGLNLILVVGVKLRLLPVAGYAGFAEKGLATLQYLVLPALALGITEAALIARMTRSSVLDVLRQDFIRTARAKGMRERTVLFRHALRNAALPIITTLGNTLAVLIGGAVVTETVFNIPGLGRLVIQSVMRRDYPMIQATVLFAALAYILINLAVDLAYAWTDPRIRYV